MAITHLDEKVDIPFDRDAIESGDPKRLCTALWHIVRTLTMDVLPAIHNVTNMLIDRGGMDWTYYGVRNMTTGEYDDGAFRVGIVDGGLEIQKKIDGTFTKINRFAS